MSDTNSTNNLMLERAKSAVLSRDYSLATRLYRTLLQSDPENTDLLFALGDLYQKSGNDAKAIPIYQQLIDKNPKDVVSMNFLGSIYRRIKQWDDSIDILEKAVIADESNIQTFYNLGFTYKLMGRNEEAIECFSTVVDENPNDVLAYNHIGSIYASEKQYEKAVQAYQRGLKIDPNHPILHLNIAHSYEKLDNDEMAGKEYEAALRSKPGWLDAIDGYASLLLKRKDTKAVSEMVSQALRLNPQVASVHSKMGQVYSLLGNYVGAESEYNASLKIDSKNFNTMADLAETYLKNGKTMDAIRTMKKGDDLCADSDVKFMKRYCDLMMGADKLNAAGHKIKQLWEKDSEDLETLNLLGQYYICRGEDAKAEGCFQKIKKLDPSAMEYLVDAARRYNQTGRYGKAEQCLKKVLQLDGSNEKALIAMADCLEKQGRYEEAIDEYQKLSAMDLDNVFYKSSMERLAQALENSQAEEYFQGADSTIDDLRDGDSLESQLRGASGDDEDYSSSSIMPSIDFSNIDHQRMSQSEMVHQKNRGYSFEGLTMEDRSMGSPFAPAADEDIRASHSTLEDFESLVPERETTPADNTLDFAHGVPTKGTGMGVGPAEGIMGDKFLEEDIDGNKRVESRTIDVSDGWDDRDDELNAPPPRPAPRNYGNGRPNPPRAPQFQNPPEQGFGDSTIDNLGDMEFDSPAEGFAPSFGGGYANPNQGSTFESDASEGFAAAPVDSYEDFAQPSPSGFEDETVESFDEPIPAESDNESSVEIEGDDEIFTPEDEGFGAESAMEFSDEEVSQEDEMIVDQVSDGAAMEEPEVENPYGFAFEDDSAEEIFDAPNPVEDNQTSEDENSFTIENEIIQTPESETEIQYAQDESSVEVTEPETEQDFETPVAIEEPEIDYVFGDNNFDQDDELDSDESISEDFVPAEMNESVEELGDESNDFEEPVAVDLEESEIEKAETLGEDDFEAPVVQDENFEEPDSDELKLSADLFIKLRDLSAYLPVDKKQQFLESHENLQLEYLIKKLSGEAGLLETAHDIREKLNLSDSDVNDLDADKTRNVLNYMKKFIPSLPNQNIARSLEDELDAAIEKL